MCDFMECDYKCSQPITEDDVKDETTFNSYFMNSNSEVIIVKIKDLFKEKYSYRKQELINKVNKGKIYPEDQINAALQYLIDKNEKLVDKIGRVGILKNVKDIYLFHLEEFSDEAKLTSYEIKKPNTVKPDKLEVTLDNIVVEKNVEELSLFNLIDDLRFKYYTINDGNLINQLNNGDNQRTMKHIIDKLIQYNFEPFKETICKTEINSSACSYLVYNFLFFQ